MSAVLPQASKGVHGSTYTKALASLKRYGPEQIADMEEASNFLAQAAGLHLWLCLRVAVHANQHLHLHLHLRS